jgi:glyoxylase-like metal-dependent hydrolase (beta-lactamase superfamily II)
MADPVLRIVTLEVGDFQACCYVVCDESARQAAVIDPGADPDRIVAAVERLGAQPVLILDTHAHIDHIGANNDLKARFPDATLCIHALDAPTLTRPSRNLSLFFGSGYKSVGADRLIEDGDEVAVGLSVFRVLHTPGHTPGGISLYCAEQGVCFTGDVLFAEGIGRSDLPGGDGDVLLESIRSKLLVLPDETKLYPGHGPATTVAHERAHNPFLR